MESRRGGVEVGIVVGGSDRVFGCEGCEGEALEVEMGAAGGSQGRRRRRRVSERWVTMSY